MQSFLESLLMKKLNKTKEATELVAFLLNRYSLYKGERCLFIDIVIITIKLFKCLELFWLK